MAAARPAGPEPMTAQQARDGRAPGTRADDGHALAVAFNLSRLNVALAEGALGYGALVLAYGDGLIHTEFEHATLFAECGANASRKLREVVGGIEYAPRLAPFALEERVLELGRTVAQRTGPVAEGYATVHAS